MLRETLKQLGLNEKEVSIYITCLKIGKCAVSTLANQCGYKRTSAHSIIKERFSKGFLFSFVKNNVTYYYALSPEYLVEKFKQEVASAQKNLYNIEKILPALASLNEESHPVKFKFFEGMDNVIKSYLEFIELIPDNSTIFNYVFPAPSIHKKFSKGMKQFIQRRKEKNLHVKLISAFSEDSVKLKLSDKFENRETRISFDNNMETISSESFIYDSFVFDMSYSQNTMFSCLTVNKDIAALRREVFHIAWEHAGRSDLEIMKRPEVKKLLEKHKAIKAYHSF